MAENKEFEKIVRNAYKNILKRTPDSGGLKNYINALKNGMKINELEKILTQSNEYQSKFSYKDKWNAESFEEAKMLILSANGETPTTEYFNSSGKLDSEYLESFVNQDDQILDYGCGVGRVAKFMSKNVKNLYAVDVSKEMITFAKEFCKECKNIEYLKTKGTTIELNDNSIDFIYTLLTLQHVEKEDAYLIIKEMNRILKNNKKIYATFPDFTSETYWKHFDGYANNQKTRTVTRTRFYTKAEVCTLLEHAGFEILEISDHSSNQSKFTEIIDDNIRVVARKV